MNASFDEYAGLMRDLEYAVTARDEPGTRPALIVLRFSGGTLGYDCDVACGDRVEPRGRKSSPADRCPIGSRGGGAASRRSSLRDPACSEPCWGSVSVPTARVSMATAMFAHGSRGLPARRTHLAAVRLGRLATQQPRRGLEARDGVDALGAAVEVTLEQQLIEIVLELAVERERRTEAGRLAGAADLGPGRVPHENEALGLRAMPTRTRPIPSPTRSADRWNASDHVASPPAEIRRARRSRNRPPARNAAARLGPWVVPRRVPRCQMPP